MQEIFKMAGRSAVHAMWSVSDGETLIPILGFLDKNNESSMERLAFEDSEHAMQHGNERLEKNEANIKGAAFIFDGYLNLDEGRVDALIVKIKGYDAFQTECTMGLPYRHASDEKGFAIFRPKVLEYPADDESDRDSNLDAFFDGVDSHKIASKVWKEKYVDTIESESSGAEGGENFTPDEWKMLIRAPYLVFLTVAAADGVIDKKEVKSFTKILMKAQKQPSPILQKILIESGGDVQSILQDILESGVNTIDALEAIQQLIDTKMSDEESIVFKASLMLVAKEIAESSGGGFLGFGKKVSEEENMAMAAIAHTLKII